MFPNLGEWLRRAALGLLALLFVTRAYYASENAEEGTGLVWVLCMLGVVGIGVASMLLAGVTRLRWSWVDLFVFLLIVLVGLSAGHAADRRPAITMAWEWAGLGCLYFLARNLPRTRSESVALAGIVVATATAVATYGLYQTAVEFPQLRALFRADPMRLMRQVDILPGTPSAESFRERLMSKEPFATFALPNSLAGFLVGPLALLLGVGLERLKRTSSGTRVVSSLLAAVPALTLIICLLLTKSRSAYLGLGVALLALGWTYRAAVPRRWLLGSGVGLAVAVLGLVAAGVATQQLDIQILSEAKKSLGYRWEYWVGSWGLITDAPPPFAPDRGAHNSFGGNFGEPNPTPTARVFWWGVGPANFAGPYLRHKLPQASEEIQDPHNMLMELWAESGLFAMVALAVILVLGIGKIMATPTIPATEADAPVGGERSPSPPSQVWLFVMGGMGWFGVWALGQLNPIAQNDMAMRWLILGVVWVLAVLMIGPMWSRRPFPAVGLGAAVLAMAVHLLAAGGIGIPAVAMVLWMSLALGLNLCDDQGSGRVREVGRLGPAVILACGWAGLVGTFCGAVVPGWRSDLAVAQGDAALASQPPRFEVARNAYTEAIALDHYSIRPWLALADLEYRFWLAPEDRERHKTSWTKVLLTLDKALEENYRDPNNLNLRRLQASYARLILSRLPDDAKPFDLLGLKSTIAKATRKRVQLYPTSAALRAELALASEALGMYGDAAAEARVALQLDALTPHRDKKLPENLRSMLAAKIDSWDKQAKAPIPAPVKP